MEPSLETHPAAPNTGRASSIAFAALPTRTNAKTPAVHATERNMRVRLGSSGTSASVPVSSAESSAPSASSSSLAKTPGSLEQRMACESRSFGLLGIGSPVAQV
ncbi:hypothetical protein B0A55_11498 [Friedmanniomyces simplex]|uniref:Uncharacterized protein n=1 Tax=Friedmanniomyces simplex TaxID=329884 RepID=A0A4U0WS56_9PEZI|nr:hypothetical protein B0A55_11498 [Friedmanniomyces simplex]